MLGSWFSSKSSDSVNKDSDSVKRTSLTEPARDNDQRPSAPTVQNAQPPPVAKFSTPHDDILAELIGVRQDKDGLKNDDKKGEQASPTEPIASSSQAAAAEAGTTESKTFKLPQQELRDPFTGALLGTLVPLTEEGDGDVDIDAKEAELWEHHAKILALQSELAQMHLEMETIGAKSDESRRKTAKGTTEADGGEEDVGVDDEATKKAREKGFESLPGKFTGREAAIDGIMNKLGDLSNTLTAFHALQMPHLNLGRSSKTAAADKPTSTYPTSPSQQPTDVPTSSASRSGNQPTVSKPSAD